MTALHILSAGAAKGLVVALQAQLEATNGCRIVAELGAAGTTAEQFLLGAPCDVLITSEAMYNRLLEHGIGRASGVAAIGIVRTSVARRVHDAPFDLSTPHLLRQSLLASDAVFLPDPECSTAGVHLVWELARASDDSSRRSS